MREHPSPVEGVVPHGGIKAGCSAGVNAARATPLQRSIMTSAAPFDRRALRAHRDRASPSFANHDFLVRHSAARIAEDFAEHWQPRSECLGRVLDLGCHTGELAEAVAGTAGVSSVVLADCAPAMVSSARQRGVGGWAFVAAEEELLPFAPASFDAVLSALSLHWVNDLPGTLVQIRKVLRPGGLLLATLLGGESLRELRAALSEAEAAAEARPNGRVSPSVDVRDAGDLMARAGFVRPVADLDAITVRYGDPLRLMHELRGMGETNARRDRPRAFTPRGVLFRAAEIYSAAHAGADNRIPATFHIIAMTAWAPDS